MHFEWRIEDYDGVNDWKSGLTKRNNPLRGAEEIAREYFNRHPHDPINFEIIVVIKTFDKTERFKVTAEPYVEFYASKL